MRHEIVREIGIDAGHRVTHHGSKCRNLHGHRYTVQAVCEGPLFAEGEQQGMVLDFGFLKEEMMDIIDAHCDHGMILWIKDPWVPVLLGLTDLELEAEAHNVETEGWVLHEGCGHTHEHGGKFYIVPFVPTAENLAAHWFERLTPRVKARTNNQATLKRVIVWETPNCSATYPST